MQGVCYQELIEQFLASYAQENPNAKEESYVGNLKDGKFQPIQKGEQ